MAGETASESIARNLPGERQKALARWFRGVARDRDDEARTSAAWAALVDTLEAIEREL